MHRVWSVFIKCFVVSFDSYSKFIYYSNWLDVYTHICSSGLSSVHRFRIHFVWAACYLFYSLIFVLFCFHFSPFWASEMNRRQANFILDRLNFYCFFFLYTIPTTSDDSSHHFFCVPQRDSEFFFPLLNLIAGSRYNHEATQF